jgi:hypothetical protein
MSNPLRILQTLDRHLTREADITLFGRAALALGFQNAPADFHNTRDVDAILSFGIRQLFLSVQTKVLRLAGDRLQ